jgi:hypothetical protein
MKRLVVLVVFAVVALMVRVDCAMAETKRSDEMVTPAKGGAGVLSRPFHLTAVVCTGFAVSPGFEMPQRLHDCNGNWDHLNLIFPVYLKLMTGFPSFQPEDAGAELLH